MDDLFNTVEERRDEAIARVAANAEEHRPGWADTAYVALLTFVATVNRPFVLEEVRAWALERDYVQSPHDDRAWGAVIRRAAANGVVAKDGYAPARSSNLSPKVRWRPA